VIRRAGSTVFQKIIDSIPTAYREKARSRSSLPGTRDASRYLHAELANWMVQIGARRESVPTRERRTPATLDELIPRRIASVPTIPGTPVLVYGTAQGYRLTCQGADGAPGGTPDAAD